MALTAQQKSTLLTDIAGNVNTVSVNGGNPVAINTLNLAVADNAFAVAAWYNQTATPDFIVWRDIPIETVLGLITYANMTPVDAADGTQLWANRSLACQGKQFNLQNLTIGRTTAPMKRTNYRAALQDCLTNLPAGASGASIAANWTGVRDSAKFQANRIEKLLATGTGTTASPADLVFEGTINYQDIQ